MKRLHYFCVTLLIGASLLLLATLQHHNSLTNSDLSFAKVVSTITDAALPDPQKTFSENARLVPDKGAITESRAIMLSVLFCIFLCVLVVFLSYRERRVKQKRDFQVQLIAASIILSFAFIALSFRFGIF